MNGPPRRDPGGPSPIYSAISSPVSMSRASSLDFEGDQQWSPQDHWQPQPFGAQLKQKQTNELEQSVVLQASAVSTSLRSIMSAAEAASNGPPSPQANDILAMARSTVLAEAERLIGHAERHDQTHRKLKKNHEKHIVQHKAEKAQLLQIYHGITIIQKWHRHWKMRKHTRCIAAFQREKFDKANARIAELEEKLRLSESKCADLESQLATQTAGREEVEERYSSIKIEAADVQTQLQGHQQVCALWPSLCITCEWLICANR